MDKEAILNEVTAFITYQGDRVFRNWAQFDIAKIAVDNVDVTTNFDIEIEREFYELVSKKFPEHGFVGEELHELNKDAELKWHIDPIDGTKYFAQGIPLWGITLALVQNETPILGLIYNPTTKQLYRAAKGLGAYLNDSKLQFKSGIETSKLQLALDLTTRKYDWDNLQDRLGEIVSQLMKDYYRVRMFGNGAYALAWLAQGMFGVYVDPYRHTDKFVDIAAGIIIAEEAGASYERINLGNSMEQIVVANQRLFDDLKKTISLK